MCKTDFFFVNFFYVIKIIIIKNITIRIEQKHTQKQQNPKQIKNQLNKYHTLDKKQNIKTII